MRSRPQADASPIATGAGCLAIIASLIPRSRKSRVIHKRESATLQLGWGVQFAHCCRDTFDSVRLAHINHLWSIKDITPLRHPLYHAERPGGRPPYRLDQAIHLITRIKTSHHLGTQWGLRTSQIGIAHSIAYAPTCAYQHHSERRSLVLQDQHLEEAHRRHAGAGPPANRQRDDLALGETGQASAMGGELECAQRRHAALSASPHAATLKGPLPHLGYESLSPKTSRGKTEEGKATLPLTQPRPQVGEAGWEQTTQREREQETHQQESHLAASERQEPREDSGETWLLQEG
jgi:hypothetical protein